MLARLQQRITLGLLACAAAWLLLCWRFSPLLAVAGGVALLGGHALFLGLEMLAMHRLNRNDPAPRARPAQVWGAWLQETLAAPRVFCWRQPFFPDAVPDHVGSDAAGRLGVVLVHGLVCNRGFWTPWLRRLRQRGQPFVAVNLEPVVGDIEGYRATLDAAVERLTRATGRPPVLVCHSMGGLVARDWLRAGAGQRLAGNNHDRVAHVFTLASPHRGTWLGRFARQGSGLQMRQGSAWLAALGATETAALRARFSCWYSHCDNVVFPASTATLPGADNRFVAGLPHVALAFDRRVMADVLGEIERLSSLPHGTFATRSNH